jgi:activator of HSP90 ATPase
MSSGNNEDAKAQADQSKAQAAEAKSKENTSKWNTYATLGTAAFSAANSTGKEVKETTDYLAKITFSNDAEELGNQLSEICSMWGGSEKYFLKDNTEAVKKAAFEKFEFGFMKLKQIGMPHQIEFFTKKQKEMKPKRFGFF